MADKAEYRLPRWAPRVRKTEIERLYRSTAQGILDHDSIDEVGYGLYTRCQSMLEVMEIRRTGRPKCPVCGTVLPRWTWTPDEMLHCPACDWECPAKTYKKTYSRKNLGTGGLDEEIRAFMRGFESARSYGEKLVLIDTLIHRFHHSSDQGRPMATALIEGSQKSTMAFLDRLTYGDSVPEEVLRTREQWREAWAKNEWSHGRGQ